MVVKNTEYILGYSKQAFSSHESRTAEIDAAFLLPHIKSTFRILDFGCGPGTISAGLAKYVPEGQVVAVDISPKAIAQARKNAEDLPGGRPSNLEFHCIDVLKEPGESPAFLNGSIDLEAKEELPGSLPTEWFECFDIIFESTTLVHLATPIKAIKGLRKFLKPSTGLFATRDLDILTVTYSPDPTGHCARIGETLRRLTVAGKDETCTGLARNVPEQLVQAGFSRDKMSVSAAAVIYATPEAREWWGQSMSGRYAEGDAVREGMIKRGILTQEECDDLRNAIIAWSKDVNGLYFMTAIQVLARL